MANVIKQIVRGEGDSQTIKMIVQSNERGPQGLQGPRGPQGPQGEQGLRGADGVIQYRAGTGINISDENIISATSEAVAAWGGIQGNINNQTDLQQEFAKYEKSADLAAVAESGNYNDLTNKPTIPTVNDATLTIQNDGTTVGTFTANANTNVTANVIPPVKIGSVLSTPTDVAFVDTVNIVNKAVTADKIDFANAQIFEKIGELVLETDRVPNDTINLTRNDCKFIKIVFTGSTPTTGASLQIRLNGDAGNNYPRVMMQRTVSTSTTDWFSDTSGSLVNAGSLIVANTPMQILAELSKSSNGWVGWGHTLTSAMIRFGLCEWTSTDNITSVLVSSSSNSTWKAGSSVVVYGHN